MRPEVRMRLGFRGFPIRLKLLSSAMIVLLPISLFVSVYFPGREEAIALAALRSGRSRSNLKLM